MNRILIWAVLLMSVATSCARSTSRTTVADHHINITGYWVSDAFQTQLGRATEDFCFASNGVFKSRLTSEGATLNDTGRYRVEGDLLILQGSTGMFTYRISLSEPGVLIVDAGDDDVRHYRRGTRRC